MYLPLAGSDPALSGYNVWLDRVSYLHYSTKPHQVRWLSVNWKLHFQNGLTPEEAIELEKTKSER